MNDHQDYARRLARLERIVSRAASRGPAEASSDADPADVHVHSIPSERIRELTSELRRGVDRPVDALDVLTMRLLLNDYVDAVGHLRAVARLTEHRLGAAAGPMKEASRVVRKAAQLQARKQPPTETQG